MFSLHLTPEQLEFRDTVRDFVKSEVHAVAIHPDRLQPFEKPLLLDLLDDASRMGLRTLALSEAAGGAGADTLTSCIVMEELAAGDVDLAVVMATTSQLCAALFDECMTADQRNRFLPEFLDERQARAHLALAAHDYDAVRGWQLAYPEVDVRWVSEAGPVDGSLLAESAAAALTVLGADRHRWLRQVMRGSAQYDVLRLARGPVVVVGTRAV